MIRQTLKLEVERNLCNSYLDLDDLHPLFPYLVIKYLSSYHFSINSDSREARKLLVVLRNVL